MLDFGDDPTKLLAEIETAKAKDHKVELGKPQNLAGSNQSAAPPANELPEAKARRLLAEREPRSRKTNWTRPRSCGTRSWNCTWR